MSNLTTTQKDDLLNELDSIKCKMLNNIITYDEAIEQVFKLGHQNNIDSTVMYNCLYSSKPEMYLNINY